MKISVIVPVYNSEEFLYDAIMSILNQTINDTEVILINDGSTDSSGLICDQLKNSDSRVKVINKRNEGVSAARNDGLKIANGEYISFVDSDDILANDMFETLLYLIEENQADISICGVRTVYLNGRIIENDESLKIEKFYRHEALDKFFKRELINYGLWTKLFKCEIAKNIHFEVGRKIGEDKFYFFQALLKSNLVVSKNINKYYYYKRENAATTSTFSNKFFDVIYFSEKMQDIIINEYPEHNDAARINNYIEHINIFRKMSGDKLALNEYSREYHEIFNKIRMNRSENVNYIQKKYRYEVQLLCRAPRLYQLLAKIYMIYMYGKRKKDGE